MGACDQRADLFAFPGFGRGGGERDSRLSQADLCVCVNDLGSLWDTERRTWHVAARGQQ